MAWTRTWPAVVLAAACPSPDPPDPVAEDTASVVVPSSPSEPADSAEPQPTAIEASTTIPVTTPAGPVTSNVGSPPNLLVVSIDTLRRDILVRYGASEYSMPFLDAKLDDAWTFDAHYSCSSWTLPSLVCALTGRRSIDLGHQDYIGTLAEIEPLPAGTESLATWLGEAGYRTGVVTASGYLASGFGLGESYQDERDGSNHRAKVIVDQALEWLDDLDGSSPWMLHAHFIDPHTPYAPEPGYEPEVESDWDLTSNSGLRDLEEAWGTLPISEQQDARVALGAYYGAQTAYLDEQLSRLWFVLGERDLLDDTVVLVFSDHGEQLMERGSIGHAEDLYAEEQLALAAMLGPGVAPGSWSGPTSHVDLPATVLDVLGLPAQPTDGYVVSEAPSDRLIWGMLAIPARGESRTSLVRGPDRLVYRWSGEIGYFRADLNPSDSNDLYDPALPAAAELWELTSIEVRRAAAHYGLDEPPDLAP